MTKKLLMLVSLVLLFINHSEGGDDIPGTRDYLRSVPSIPLQYVPQPDFVDDFNIENWTPIECSESPEASLVRCGIESARVTRDFAGTCAYRRDFGDGNEKDWTEHVFYIRYYIEPDQADNLAYNSMWLHFLKGSGYSDAFVMGSLPVAPGWNEVTFCPAQGSYLGSMTDLSSVYGVSISAAPREVVGEGVRGISVVYDCFFAIPTGRTKGAVIFTFDDGILSSYKNGINYLQKYGFPSMWYISPEYIVEAGETRNVNSMYGDFANWEEIRYASEGGSMICTHASSMMPNSDIDELRIWCENQKKYLIDRGYVSGAEFMAIPAGQDMWYGTLSERQMMEMSKQYFLHIRGTQPWWINSAKGAEFGGNSGCQPFYLVDPRWGWSSGDDSVTSAISKIDRAIEEKDVYSFYTHDVSDTSAMTSEEFRTIVDYVKTKVDQGQLEVITYADMLNKRLNCWTVTTATPQKDAAYVVSTNVTSIVTGKNYKGQAVVTALESEGGLALDGRTVTGVWYFPDESTVYQSGVVAVTDVSGNAVFVSEPEKVSDISRFTFVVTAVDGYNSLTGNVSGYVDVP